MKRCIELAFVMIFFTAAFGMSQNNQPYLGQTPPGLTDRRFPPDSLLGNSLWWWHGSPAFTADGLEMFFTEYVRHSATNENMELFTMKVENNNWGPVHHPAFADTSYMENSPVLSVTGDTLYFFSTRPGGPFFRTVRNGSGWTQPSPVSIPVPAGSSYGLEFAVAGNRDFYIELSNPPSAPSDLYVSRFVNGTYQLAENLGPKVNSAELDAFPFVDPAGEYLILASKRPGGFGGQFDMYICFRDGDSSWTQAMNMGFEINSTGAWFASVSLDKQYLFFNTWKAADQGYNPYWISAAVIDSLHTIVGIADRENSSAGNILQQNEPNPFSDKTSICFSLETPSTVNLFVTDLLGKRVATLIRNEKLSKGIHRISFSPQKYNLPAGIYSYSLLTNDGWITKKMICSD